MPWVMKVWLNDRLLACDFIIYIDDVRSTGNLRVEARLAARTLASMLNWLRLQDATRKWKDLSQTPGPWAGLFFYSDDETFSVSVAQERWDKAKAIVGWIKESITFSD
jgi:hypothetical protein